jgi:hypothetical protein
VLCGQPMIGGGGVCAFHFYEHEEGWATGNRIMCDFVHRRIVRPAPPERADTLELLVGGLEEAVTS